MKRRWWLVFPAIVLAVAGFTISQALREGVMMRRALKRAGHIIITPMRTDIDASSAISLPTIQGDAAPYYVNALNHYEASRLPYVAKQRLAPIATEPPITAHQLDILMHGADQRSYHLYTYPPLRYATAETGKLEPLIPTTDPFASRPYITSWRRFAQAALNEGKTRQDRQMYGDAKRIYESVARMAIHMRSQPGSLMDIQLSLEIELNALHYLQALYSQTNRRDDRAHVETYSESVMRLRAAVWRKYHQLEDPYIAIYVLRHDTEPVWRVEAIAALATTMETRNPGWSSRRAMIHALNAAKRSSNAQVNSAARSILRHSVEDTAGADNAG